MQTRLDDALFLEQNQPIQRKQLLQDSIARTYAILEQEKIRFLSDAPVSDLELVTLAYFDPNKKVFRLVPVLTNSTLKYKKGKLHRVRIDNYFPGFLQYDLITCSSICEFYSPKDKQTKFSFHNVSKHEQNSKEHYHTIPDNVQDTDIYVLSISFWREAYNDLKRDKKQRIANRARQKRVFLQRQSNKNYIPNDPWDFCFDLKDKWL